MPPLRARSALVLARQSCRDVVCPRGGADRTDALDLLGKSGGAFPVVRRSTVMRKHGVGEQHLRRAFEQRRITERLGRPLGRGIHPAPLAVEQGRARQDVGEAVLRVGDAQVGERRFKTFGLIVDRIGAQTLHRERERATVGHGIGPGRGGIECARITRDPPPGDDQRADERAGYDHAPLANRAGGSDQREQSAAAGPMPIPSAAAIEPSASGRFQALAEASFTRSGSIGPNWIR